MEAAAAMVATQYLTFTLDDELFALDIACVREVLDWTTVTRVPQSPDYLRGVINLRGNVVPVVDMRLKLGLPPAVQEAGSCIVIVEVGIDGEQVLLGATTDAVQEVLDIDPGQIEPPPRLGTRLKTDFIRGMGRQEHRFIIMLNLDRVFAGEECAVLAGQPGPDLPSDPE